MGPHLESGQRPDFVYDRPLIRGDDPKGGVFAGAPTEIARVGAFWTPTGPLAGPATGWLFTDSGPVVVVPMYGYRVGAKALARLVAASFELGVRALEQLREHTEARPIEVVYACGDVVTELPDDFRFYLGVTIRVEESA